MATRTDEPVAVTDGEVQRLQSRLRAMTVAVVVLAVALIGLGAWVIYDLAAKSDTAATGEVETLLEDYTTAWNDYDGEAFLGLVTDDYTFEYSGDVRSASEEAAEIDGLGAFDWSVERIGDPIMIGDGPTYLVASADRVSTIGRDADGISLYTIVEDGDTLRISHHLFMDG